MPALSIKYRNTFALFEIILSCFYNANESNPMYGGLFHASKQFKTTLYEHEVKRRKKAFAILSLTFASVWSNQLLNFTYTLLLKKSSLKPSLKEEFP